MRKRRNPRKAVRPRYKVSVEIWRLTIGPGGKGIAEWSAKFASFREGLSAIKLLSKHYGIPYAITEDKKFVAVAVKGRIRSKIAKAIK